MTSRRLFVSVLAVLGLLAGAAPVADAKLPKTGTITPGKSLGKVKVGMKAETAVAKFGKGGTCDEVVAVTCRWEGAGGAEVSFEVRDGKVSSLSMTAGQRANGTPIYSGAITKWKTKTKKKIGIGSNLADVLKAYKKAQPSGSGVDLVSGRYTTYFNGSGGRVFRIDIAPTGG